MPPSPSIDSPDGTESPQSHQNPQSHQLRVAYLNNFGEVLDEKGLRHDLFISKSWKLVNAAASNEGLADLLILGTHLKKNYLIFAQVLRAKLKWGIRSFIVALTQESMPHGFPCFDYSISFEENSPTNFYLACTNNHMRTLEPMLKQQLSPEMQANRAKPKPHFCNYIYSNDIMALAGVRDRINFCRQLSKYQRVDCAGKSLNNTDALQQFDRKLGKRFDHLLEFMTGYKFSISFENIVRKGYITEKIWHAFAAGGIPIYWGAPDIADYFNPKAFVNCHDYDDFAAVVRRVREINEDPELYRQYMQASPVLPNSKLHQLSSAKISAAMDDMLRLAETRRQRFAAASHPRLLTARLWLGFLLTNLHLLLMYLALQPLRILKRILTQPKAQT